MRRDEVLDFIRKAHFGYLATSDLDSGVSVRPVGIDTVYGDSVYFFTFATNPKVSVVWADHETLSQVRIKGEAHVENDPDVIARFKADNPIVDTMLPPDAAGLFMLYRVEPDVVQAAQGLVPYSTVDW
jgi:uncharacterized pyridoxamine 5'-phosphate oxidase family protein